MVIIVGRELQPLKPMTMGVPSQPAGRNPATFLSWLLALLVVALMLGWIAFFPQPRQSHSAADCAGVESANQPGSEPLEQSALGRGPSDPLQTGSLRRGEALANKQPAWISERAADWIIDDLIEREVNVKLNLAERGVSTEDTDWLAFRFGFKARMEQRFKRQY